MKWFVITDVHSFYDEMMTALKIAGFDKNNEQHGIISCGDLLDRGPAPIKCLKFINSIPNERKILIRGNHEDLLEECFKRGNFLSHDKHNCTLDTIFYLANKDPKEFYYSDWDSDKLVIEKAKHNKELQKYLQSVVNYAEIGPYIFVHSWIPYENENWQEGKWENARWGNPFQLWKEGFGLPDRTIVCGHWHVSWAHSIIEGVCKEFPRDTQSIHEAFKPFIAEGIIGLDSCVAYSKFCNCYVIDVKNA